jgi:hypothetical protein
MELRGIHQRKDPARIRECLEKVDTFSILTCASSWKSGDSISVQSHGNGKRFKKRPAKKLLGCFPLSDIPRFSKLS